MTWYLLTVSLRNILQLNQLMSMSRAVTSWPSTKYVRTTVGLRSDQPIIVWIAWFCSHNSCTPNFHIFWVVISCLSLLDSCCRFGGSACLFVGAGEFTVVESLNTWSCAYFVFLFLILKTLYFNLLVGTCIFSGWLCFQRSKWCFYFYFLFNVGKGRSKMVSITVFTWSWCME
jgi:hypothetical protein